MKRQILAFFMSVMTAVSISSVAHAHGSLEPEHGGILQEKGDLIVELVSESDGISIYLRDHDQPLDSSRISGSVTILAMGEKSEMPLVPAGNNKMTVNIMPTGGMKLLVTIQEEGHESVTVRFAL